MKLTLAAFFAALLVAIMAIALPAAVPQHPPAATAGVPLDLAGVDTLVIAGTHSNRVQFGADGRTFPPAHGNCDVNTRREGSTLHVTGVGEGFSCVNLQVPATIRRIEADSVEIFTDERLADITVVVSRDLAWRGPAERMRVLDRDDGPGCPPQDDYACRSSINIYEGSIARLQVESPTGQIAINMPGSFGAIELALGEAATFSLGRARALPPLTVVELEAETPAEIAPAAPEAAAETNED